MTREIIRQKVPYGNGPASLNILVNQVIEQFSRPFKVVQLIQIPETTRGYLPKLPRYNVVYMARKSPNAIAPKGVGAHSEVNNQIRDIQARTGINQGRRIRKHWWQRLFKNKR